MLIDRYYSAQDNTISFSRTQGCDFAKQVADDYNPLHDAEAKRFCIPGDLLFAVVLARYGVSQHMEFVFAEMVPADVPLELPTPAQDMHLRDASGREYLQVIRRGEASRSEALIQALTRSYVEYSGHTFPHILHPLMAEQGVMINPARPLIMYQSMTIDLDTLEIDALTLAGDHDELQVNGRRGEASLTFNLLQGGRSVGRGCKRMLLGGLRDYDAEAMAGLIGSYNERKYGNAAG